MFISSYKTNILIMESKRERMVGFIKQHIIPYESFDDTDDFNDDQLLWHIKNYTYDVHKLSVMDIFLLRDLDLLKLIKEG